MILKAIGPIGLGDIMLYLNTAYTLSHIHNTTVELHLFWDRSSNTPTHVDDVEYLWDQIMYLRQFYTDHEKTTVHMFFPDTPKHQFISTPEHRDIGRGFPVVQYPHSSLNPLFTNPYLDDPTSSWWPMRTQQTTIPNKVILWRETWNGSKPQQSKQGMLTKHDWDNIIIQLKHKGYNLVEIDYRTPVREALWHIATSELCICYDGMWHRISVNLMKPTIVTTKISRGKLNTFNGYPVSDYEELSSLIDTEDFVDIVKLKNQEAKERAIYAYKHKIDWTKENPFAYEN